MSEPDVVTGDWTIDESDIVTDAPRERRVPRWVWGCGCGCLVLVVLAVAAVGWILSQVEKATDPELVWDRFAQALPHEERPENFEPWFQLGMFSDADVAMMHEVEQGFLLTLILPDTAAEATEILDAYESGGMGGFDSFAFDRAGTLDVQGREVRAVWGTAETASFMMFGGDAFGSTVVMDLSTEGRPAVLQLTGLNLPTGADALEEGAEPSESEPGAQVEPADDSDEVTDAQIAELLAPFDVWGRE